MNHLLLLEYSHISKFNFDSLLEFTDEWCEKITDHQRKKESLLARFLLNNICMKLRNKSIFQCGFKKNDLGRPFFENHPELFISITHTAGYVWVAVASSPIGIDFELIDYKYAEDLKIAFDDSDWKIVSKNTDLIYKYFSLKESFSKMQGIGFTKEPSEIKINDINKDYYFIYFENNKIKYIFTLVYTAVNPNKLINLEKRTLRLIHEMPIKTAQNNRE